MRTTFTSCAFGFVALLALAAPAGAAEETTVQTPDGQTRTVRSDEAGTTVINEGKAPGASAVTPLEAQHQEGVKDVLKDGGVVTEQKNPQR